LIKVTEKDVGRTVIYKKEWMTPRHWEYGVITSFNDSYVFVRYGADTHSKATRRQDLYYAQDDDR